MLEGEEKGENAKEKVGKRKENGQFDFRTK
jgi:hypothetical protein